MNDKRLTRHESHELFHYLERYSISRHTLDDVTKQLLERSSGAPPEEKLILQDVSWNVYEKPGRAYRTAMTPPLPHHNLPHGSYTHGSDDSGQKKQKKRKSQNRPKLDLSQRIFDRTTYVQIIVEHDWESEYQGEVTYELPVFNGTLEGILQTVYECFQYHRDVYGDHRDVFIEGLEWQSPGMWLFLYGT